MKKLMALFIITLGLIWFATGCPQKKKPSTSTTKTTTEKAPDPDDKGMLIAELFETMSMEDTLNQERDEAVKSVKKQIPLMIQDSPVTKELDKDQVDAIIDELSPKYQKSLEKELNAIFAGNIRIRDIYMPIYGKHFTAEEIAELIKFYESPVGKKLIKKTPDINKEVMEQSEDVVYAQVATVVDNLKVKIEKDIRDLGYGESEEESMDDIESLLGGDRQRPRGLGLD